MKEFEEGKEGGQRAISLKSDYSRVLLLPQLELKVSPARRYSNNMPKTGYTCRRSPCVPAGPHIDEKVYGPNNIKVAVDLTNRAWLLYQ